MAYIGKQPVVGNFQVCDAISVVNGQAAYTMQVSSTNVEPENANHMLVSLNGVLQKPGSSFTISGATITFASNLATGDVIDFIILLGDTLNIGTPSDATVTTAKLGSNAVTTAKINDGAITSAKINSSVGLGITEADNWRITSTQSISANTHTLINSSWERNDNDYDKIGTGMTESSGIFSFPSTGIYLISFQMVFDRTGGSRYFTAQIHISTDSGSSFNERARTFTSLDNQGVQTFTSTVASCMVDVTNASNFRLKFLTDGDATYSLMGDTGMQRTGFYCLRLGDT